MLLRSSPSPTHHFGGGGEVVAIGRLNNLDPNRMSDVCIRALPHHKADRVGIVNRVILNIISKQAGMQNTNQRFGNCTQTGQQLTQLYCHFLTICWHAFVKRPTARRPDMTKHLTLLANVPVQSARVRETTCSPQRDGAFQGHHACFLVPCWTCFSPLPKSISMVCFATILGVIFGCFAKAKPTWSFSRS